jgi:hypothetical protein
MLPASGGNVEASHFERTLFVLLLAAVTTPSSP